MDRNADASALIDGTSKTIPTIKDKGGMVTNVKAMMLAKAGKNRETETTIQRVIEIGRAALTTLLPLTHS